MAIQNRRGDYADFDPQKMLEGEIAVVKSNDPYGKQSQGIYYAFQTGQVKRIADYDENYEAIAKSWAVGPHGLGDMGTDSNNAKYWAGIAELTTTTPPYIDATTGHWFVYDAARAEYVDSGVDASITVQVADVTMLNPNADPYVTNTGTDTDPVFHLFIPRGFTGKTAYESAVEGGYPDSEAVFESDLANFKNLSDSAVAAATAAATSETNAATSETNAATSASIAAAHENTASIYAANASSAATRASQKATAAEASAQAAEASATAAAQSESNASQSETNAASSASNAETSETNAAASESAAEGYAQDAKTYYESMGGSVLFMGAIYFADLPSDPATGWQYCIKDSFTTDSRFDEVGVSVPSGSYVAYTANGKWSVTKTNNDIYFDDNTETIVFQ